MGHRDMKQEKNVRNYLKETAEFESDEELEKLVIKSIKKDFKNLLLLN